MTASLWGFTKHTEAQMFNPKFMRGWQLVLWGVVMFLAIAQAVYFQLSCVDHDVCTYPWQKTEVPQ
jgi:hypothetical protein